MSKNLKLRIKNEQLAKGLNLSGVKKKLAKKKATPEKEKAEKEEAKVEEAKAAETAPAEETPKPKRRARARSKSAFAQEDEEQEEAATEDEAEAAEETVAEEVEEQPEEASEPAEEQVAEAEQEVEEEPAEEPQAEPEEAVAEPEVEAEAPVEEPQAVAEQPKSEAPVEEVAEQTPEPKQEEPKKESKAAKPKPAAKPASPRVKLGPTGRHINDLLPKKKPAPAAAAGKDKAGSAAGDKDSKWKGPKPKEPATAGDTDRAGSKGPVKGKGPKQYRDVKPGRRHQRTSSFDARDRQGLRAGEEEGWRKRRRGKQRAADRNEDLTIRPTELTIRLPIMLKDLAAEMKLKAAQIISKLFMQGMVVTLNDALDDETVVGLIGEEFGCKITIDTTEEDRIRITDKSIKEEIAQSDEGDLVLRPPVVTFMGHVDHGKTSLIDSIRSSNIAAGEAGAITQHIGAFLCHTPAGDIAVLDTPGHEAFSAMRARGAEVTDIVVLVVAGDEGMRQQTIEAIQHAKAANVSIVVAINKADKPGFNTDTVYRQLAEHELMPEAWGGQTITVNTSATTGEGIKDLLEMLALQSEVMELRADPTSRARGSVLESEMCKGRGNVARIFIQNGTLHLGDAVVFGSSYGRVKTMQNDQGLAIEKAGPSTPVEITGLSALPEAGEEFIVVESEKEAREIAEVRAEELLAGARLRRMKPNLESLLQQAHEDEKKTLALILRADVQGSLEALKAAILKIESDKVDVNVIFTGVGEISESDIQLAAASNAMIIGFHTQVESHADSLIKETGVRVRTHDIIYHAIDDVKALMTGLLDKVAEEKYCGLADVQATFKSSQLGIIAGCLVADGTINRNHQVRVLRDDKEIWKGGISSIKRVQDDVREVTKGLECGIVLDGFREFEVGDKIEAFEIIYLEQEL